jgi:hypothetical protein
MLGGGGGAPDETSLAEGALPVFPGAEGTGTKTPAGRGGQVIRVTNLNDAGPGSLREALSANTPRIVIFDVSGTIVLKRHIAIKHPYLTLAGQTAPSPGITIRGAMLIIQTHDVLIQHIRTRIGDDPAGPNPGSRDAMRVIGEEAYNVVIDHVSLSWSTDEVIATGNTRDVTISSSILAEGLSNSIHPKGEHSKGPFMGEGSHNITWLGNLIAHNRDRNPGIKANVSAIFVNNLVYNWGNSMAIPVWDAEEVNRPVQLSIAGNAFIIGPSSRARPFCVRIYETVVPGSKIYLSDNICPRGGSDPWSIADNRSPFDVKTSSPPVWAPLTVRPSHTVEAWVLETAGARPADRDAVDRRITNEVRTRTGRIIDSQDQVGGWPVLAENRRSLPLPADPNGFDIRSGYTNIEIWLHALAAEVEGRRPST